MFRSVLTTVAVTILCFSSCSPRQEKLIIGKWQATDSPATLEFLDDGTVIMSERGITFTGKYAFIENDRLRCEFGGLLALAGPQVFGVSVSQNELTTTSTDGNIDRYERFE